MGYHDNHRRFKVKYLKSILFLLAAIPVLQASAELKTFEGLRPPVYEHRQGESNGVVRYIDVRIKPSIAGRIYNLPNGERLTWKYSIQGQRDGNKQDGVCFITSSGDIHILEDNVQPDDVCIVTVTVSAPGYENKSISVTVSIENLPTPPPPELRTFGDIEPPVYLSTSRGGYGYDGDYRFIYLETPPKVGGHAYFLPGARSPLKWKFSVQRKRGDSMSDGTCYIAGFGVLRIDSSNIRRGDICLVTATVSHPGYESKSVSVEVHWYGPQDIRTLPHTPPPPKPKLKTFGDIEPPVYLSTSRGGYGYGGNYRFIYLETPPKVGGHTYFLPGARSPLRWKFSVQRKRGNSMSDGACYIAGFGVLRIDSSNIRRGDICLVTTTVSHPGYESKSVSVEVHWYGPQDIRTLPDAP